MQDKNEDVSIYQFAKTELAAAVTRGVGQCVIIASPPELRETIGTSRGNAVRTFTLDEERAPETLAEALEKTDFDKLRTSLFVWLGGAAYRTLDGVLASLAFIASLPKGTGVVLDYWAERTDVGAESAGALDGLASRLSLSSGYVKHLIQPQAVSGMLAGLGFRRIVDLVKREDRLNGGHFVSAVV